jgi:uncharacterized protein YcfJ
MTALTLAAAISLALTAQATHASHVFEDYARVTQATPQYEQVNLPHKECFSEYVPEPAGRHRSLAGPLIGGIAGGVLGAQVGKGSGRVAASAVGAAIGAIVGDRMSDRRRDVYSDEYYEREVRRCRMVDHWETRVVGYKVVYRYRGRTQTAMLPYDPGPKLLLRVAIEPVEQTLGSDDDWDQ